MQDPYPRSTTWPYLIAAAVMFVFLVVPDTQWSLWTSRLRSHAGLKEGCRLHSQLVASLLLLQRVTHELPVGSPADPSTVIVQTRVARRSGPEPSAPDAVPAELPTSRFGHLAQLDSSRLRPRPAAWDAVPIRPVRVEPQPPVARKVEPPVPKIVDGRLVPPGGTEPETPNVQGEAAADAAVRSDPSLADLPPVEPLRQEAKQPQPTYRETVPAPAKSNEPHEWPWPRTRQLHALLDQAQSVPALNAWIEAVRRELASLEGVRLDGSSEQRLAISRLSRLSNTPTLGSTTPYTTRQLAARIAYALRRRTDTWLPIAQLAAAMPADSRRRASIASLEQQVAALEIGLATGEHAAAWREFLAVDELLKTTRQRAESDVAALATMVLVRIWERDLTAEQEAFLNLPAIQTFRQSIRAVMAAEKTPGELVTALEAYESTPSKNNADHVIQILRRWRSSPNAADYQPIVEAVTTHYRNANLRVAVQGDLINRMVPAISSYAEQVNDTILGAQVSGENSTSTRLSVSLIPDPEKIRLQLNAQGEVQSKTTSRKGPVTMFNGGQSTFSAGKQLIVQPNGIFLSKTTATVNAGNRLLGLRSDLDQIPLLGWLVRTFAVQQHDDQRSQVRAEIMKRIRRSASQKIDREVQQRLADAERRIDQKIVGPLRQLELEPKALEMRTTQERIVMRARIASPLQFGAHSPRPQARADSMLSLQVHQSAANNLIEQLDLQGRRLTLAELMDAISDRFGLDLHVNDERNNDVIIEFADQNPLEFAFEKGKVTLTIHFAELDNGRRQWKNFSVRGYYRADVDQLDVELVRDEGIELISDRLRLVDQLALRGIFTKVLARNQRLDILRRAIEQQPKLQGLTVTQFTIRDGWLAISLGEPRVAPSLVRRRAVRR